MPTSARAELSPVGLLVSNPGIAARRHFQAPGSGEVPIVMLLDGVLTVTSLSAVTEPAAGLAGCARIGPTPDDV